MITRVVNPTALNAKDFGAKGDGVTDDTVALRAALAAGATAKKTVVVPTGTYLTDALDVPSNSHLVIDLGAVLQVRVGNTSIFRIGSVAGSATNIVIEGEGTLSGTWRYATFQGNNSTPAAGETAGGRKASEALVKISNDNPVLVSDITIRGLRFDLGAHSALFIASSGATKTIQDVLVEDVVWLRNFQGLYILNTDDQAKLRRFTFRRVRVDETWWAGNDDATQNAALGGNGFAINNSVDDLIVQDCKFLAAGRIALEITPPGYNSTTNRKMGRRHLVEGNYVGPSVYRAFSCFAWGGTYRDNDIYEQDFVELGGTDLDFTGNRVHGNGIETQGYAGDAVRHRDFASNLRMHHNSFFLDRVTRYETAGFNAPGCLDSFFDDNDIIVSSAMDPVGTVRRPVIRLLGCVNTHARRNTVRWTAATVDRAMIGVQQCTGCEVTDNRFDILGTTILASIIGIYAPVALDRLDRCVVSGNRVRATNYLAAGYAPVWVNPPDPVRIIRRAFTGVSTYADTTATSALVTNTPPGVPAVNDLYLTGDAPTGAWVANPRQFALWNGSAWTFQALTDLFFDLTDAYAYCPVDGDAPTRAAAGLTYAIVRGAAMVKCVIEENRFDDKPNMLKGTSFGGGIVFNGTTALAQIAWANRFTYNDIPADYATRGKTGIIT